MRAARCQSTKVQGNFQTREFSRQRAAWPGVGAGATRSRSEVAA